MPSSCRSRRRLVSNSANTLYFGGTERLHQAIFRIGTRFGMTPEPPTAADAPPLSRVHSANATTITIPTRWCAAATASFQSTSTCRGWPPTAEALLYGGLLTAKENSSDRHYRTVDVI